MIDGGWARGWARAVTALAVAVAGALLGATDAAADGGPAAGDVTVAQSLGDRELTVVLRRPPVVPGPLVVDVITHAGVAPGTLRLTLRADGLPAAAAPVLLGDRPATHGVTLPVDHAGPWELAIDDGEQVATIPFVVPGAVVAPWQRVAYGGFVIGGLLLVVTLVVATRARRTATALLPGAGVAVALAVAVTGAVLSSAMPPPVEPGRLTDPTRDTVADPYAASPAADPSRPPAIMVAGARVAPSGRSVDVTLDLADGATGRPVDDLLPHHGAFAHLVLVGPTGRLWHLHPVRTAPGHLTARFAPGGPGRYAVAVELARRGGGVQLLRSVVVLPALGTDPAADTGPPAVGHVEVEPAPAGSVSTVVATVGNTAELQPWLGMAGHLLVSGPLPDGDPVGAAVAAAPVWAHVHSMTGLPRTGVPPDETVAALGPEVRFAYTFPLPGRYRLWFQTMRDATVLTVPATVDVPPAGARP